MSKQSSPISHETLSGKPARWMAGMPALVFGGLAFLVAVYGQWILPAQLPTRYASVAEQLQVKYQQIRQRGETADIEQLQRVAGEIDVVYSRLTALENGNPARYWQWAKFQDEHAQFLRQSLASPSGSLSEAARDELQTQARSFDEKARNVIEQLSVGESEFKSQAILWSLRGQYENGIAGTGIPNAAALATQVEHLLASEIEGIDSEPNRLLVLQLAMESIWDAYESGTDAASANSGTLQEPSPAGTKPELLDQAKLLAERRARIQSVWETYQRLAPQHPEAKVQWQSVAAMLYALGAEGAVAPEATLPANVRSLVASKEQSWQERLAEIELACVTGEWEAVAYTLSRQDTNNNVAVRAGAARTICRLAASELATVNSEWLEKYPVGLNFAWQIGANLPEFPQLMWEAAIELSGGSAAPLVLSPGVADAIAGSSSNTLKHTLLAFARALNDEFEVSRSHLELLHRAAGNLTMVARIALTYDRLHVLPTPEMDRQIETLLQQSTQIDAQDGAAWLALGVIQLRESQATAAVASLTEAQQLLGKVPVVEQYLKVATEASRTAADQ
ncbi:hypothetical protein [Aureliella helgolandensis]|uniref:Uncharacterized protein n=1 Tax=Aureliella helgolandensis TaxID=2527968 RepID=A0A518GBZ9_9BACT|nr:hypothetical protein [Aureliella helgolandensis]QDV26146.1 hypothetical protein Q31a_45180 [Aureliella helgolandensis]